MGFYEYDLMEAGGIARSYFENSAEAVLTEISDWDFRVVGLPQARFYSSLYAEARLNDASMKLDMSMKESDREEWISEHDRWHKAVIQAREGEYGPLSEEIVNDAVGFVKNSENEEEGSFATALFRISEMLVEGEQKK